MTVTCSVNALANRIRRESDRRLERYASRVRESLQELTVDVMQAHALRLDRCETLPVERRPYQHRPRPKTAIIAEACERKMREREVPWNT
jgi:hypothetical protein